MFAVARTGWCKGMRVTDEIIFYPDDLPEHGVAVIREYIEKNTMTLAGNERRWRDEPAVTVHLMTLSQFMKDVFYDFAYRKRGLVIGFNLPFDFGRLAWNWGPAKSRRSAGGWSLTLWTYFDKERGQILRDKFKPNLTITKAGPRLNFISFGSTREDKNSHGDKNRRENWQGEFLDLGTLAFALTNGTYSLAGAYKAFCDGDLDKDVEHGVITPDYITYSRNDVKATVTLAKALLSRFDDHPVSRANGGKLSETKCYSPASLAKAYLDAVGYKAPTMPVDRIGMCMAAFHGGWTETHIRGRAPVALLDFTNMYQTVFVLQRMQGLLSAEELVFEDATAAIIDFVDGVTLDDLFKQETWPLLRALCWVRPNGETLTVKAKFNDQTFTTGMVPRYSHREVPYYLADVVLAKILFGKAPDIVRAERILAKGRQHDLKTIEIPGGRTFDPEKDDFFKMNVEESRRMKEPLADGIDIYGHIDPTVRKGLTAGLKCIGNSGAFGIFVETNEQDLLGDASELVELHGSQNSIPVELRHPEEPGRFFCPAIGAAITAGARLMLGLAHRLVHDKGGTVAFGDTDSLAVVATRTGRDTKIRTTTGDIHGGSKDVTLKTLSWVEVAEIAEAFEKLNPYDDRVMPGSILSLTDENFSDKGRTQQQELTALCVSSKRYYLKANSDVVEYKETALGAIMSPLETASGDDRRDSPGKWIEAAWQAITFAFDEGVIPADKFPWISLPRVRQLAVTSPHVMKNLKVFKQGKPREQQIRPFNFFIATSANFYDRTLKAHSKKGQAVVASYERNPAKWPELDWISTETGETVNRDNFQSFITINSFLTAYGRHASKEWLDGTGDVCDHRSYGLMERRPVRDGDLYLLTKASLDLGDSAETAFVEDQGQAFAVDPGDSWRNVIVPALRIIGKENVTIACGVKPARAKEWLLGRSQPSDMNLVLRRVARKAEQLGLDVIAAPDPMQAIIREAQLARFFNVMVTSTIVDSLGGVRRAAVIVGATPMLLGRWHRCDAAPQSLRAINDHVLLLGKYARSKLLDGDRRLRSDSIGLFREREYVVDHLRNDGVIRPLDPETAMSLVWCIIVVVIFTKYRDTLERLSKSFLRSTRF